MAPGILYRKWINPTVLYNSMDYFGQSLTVSNLVKAGQNDLAPLSNLPVELHLMILDQLRLGEADELVRFSCPFFHSKL